MPKVKLNKTFDFEIHNVAFGDLTKEEAIDICKDGRLASHFLERQLTKWFPELTNVDVKNYDHVPVARTTIMLIKTEQNMMQRISHEAVVYISDHQTCVAQSENLFKALPTKKLHA